MKSDVIHKRSRHDARRASITGAEDTPSASPGPSSARASPVREASPTLAPDSTKQLSYDFEEDTFRAISAPSASELSKRTDS
jgi:GATA-binding protein